MDWGAGGGDELKGLVCSKEPCSAGRLDRLADDREVEQKEGQLSGTERENQK